ncbi:MAG: helix-turn-helix transcriptional regulator [Acetobacteraceae bacterium]
MARPTSGSERLLRPLEVGKLIAAGRRRAKLSQQVFAERLGVSRKTVSDLERGAAENVSLKTAMAALSQAGYVLSASVRRTPSLAEIMAQRAAHRTRVEELSAEPTASGHQPED